jgi:hypothetical protein
VISGGGNGKHEIRSSGKCLVASLYGAVCSVCGIPNTPNYSKNANIGKIGIDIRGQIW